MTNAQSIDIGPLHFTVLRILIILGVIRTLTRNERLPGGLIGLDKIILLWAMWLLFSSAFHEPFSDALVLRLGAVYNAIGLYFLIRVFCRDEEDVVQLIKMIAFVLIPVALEMINEKLTGRNLFSYLSGVPEGVATRNGSLRAQGPFGHSILAGTVGAVCVPLMISIWNWHKTAAKVGLFACLVMVFASTSSGPIMSVIFGVGALILWRWRRLTGRMRFAAIVVYFILDLIASRPAYYAILNRIDLTGSSTGWHRAELIKQAFIHLDEWWLAGTDYTRHWMPYGVSSSPNHVDLTNQYLFYGSWGGLPLMLLFICALWTAFRYVGHSVRLQIDQPIRSRFLVWALGAGLFTHALTCVTVAYFDQSVMFLYLYLALIGSTYARASSESDEVQPFCDPEQSGKARRESAIRVPN